MTTLKIQTVQTISLDNWNKCVKTVYGRPYHLQQQDGCMERGTVDITVPGNVEEIDSSDDSDYPNSNVMGVPFDQWIVAGGVTEVEKRIWERHYYPSVDMVAEDLYNRGILPAGTYQIEIDW